MGLDLRIPLGLLFVLIGVILLGYGALTTGSSMYLRSMGENVNIAWGSVLTLFGAVMLLLAYRARGRASGGGARSASTPQRPH